MGEVGCEEGCAGCRGGGSSSGEEIGDGDVIFWRRKSSTSEETSGTAPVGRLLDATGGREREGIGGGLAAPGKPADGCPEIEGREANGTEGLPTGGEGLAFNAPTTGMAGATTAAAATSSRGATVGGGPVEIEGEAVEGATSAGRDDVGTAGA